MPQFTLALKAAGERTGDQVPYCCAMRREVEDYFLNPPPGSAAARAVEFGIDLTLTLENLRLTPEERIRQLQNHIAGIAKMKATAKCLGPTAALHGKPEQRTSTSHREADSPSR